jgi:hypothetical protein
MAVKFNELSFDLKDLMLICGFVAAYYSFNNKIDERFNQIEIKLNKIVGDFTLENFKTNAKIDMMKGKETSDKVSYKPELIAICNNEEIRLKRKKLFNYKLI